MWRSVIVLSVAAILMVLLLLGWFVYDQSRQEGMADLITFSRTIERMFMSPDTRRPPGDESNYTVIVRPTYNLETGNVTPVTYYVPKGWYIVMIKEYIQDPKNGNASPVTAEVPRMTILDENCKLVNGNVAPKNANKNSPACMSTLDITGIKTSEAISQQMDKNQKLQIEDYFKNYSSDILEFYGRDFAAEKKVDPALKTDMEDYEKAMKSGEDTAFEDSQAALEAAKQKFKDANKKSEDKDFDPNKNLLQFDPVMPVFWDNALLQNKDNLMPLFREPGSFRDYGKTYVPSHEDSVFYSEITGLPEFAAVKGTPEQLGGFCNQLGNDQEALEQKCNSLSTDVCASTDCCVMLGGSKCVAGNGHGPTTPSNYSDFTIQNRDFYYFKGKCYGNCYQNGASSMYVNSANKFPYKDPTTTAMDEATKNAIENTWKMSKTPKKVKVGSVIDAMYSDEGDSYSKKHGKGQWYSAKITKDVSELVWEVEWLEPPVKGEVGFIEKDTLQRVKPKIKIGDVIQVQSSNGWKSARITNDDEKKNEWEVELTDTGTKVRVNKDTSKVVTSK